MKTLFTSALIILWGCTLFAFHSVSNIQETCHLENLSSEDLDLEKRIIFDLTSGVWSTDDLCDSRKTSIQFNSGGKMHFIFEKENTKPNFEQYFWQLEKTNGMYFLSWICENLEQKSSFKIEQTCEGILLTDPVTDLEVCLKKMPSIAQKEMDFAKTSLIGNWENASYPFKERKKKFKNAFFHYSFAEDGTYQIQFGDDKKEFRELGIWEISKDGKFVIFHKNNSSSVYLAKIKHLDLDEMVLEQELKIQASKNAFPQRWETLTFVK